MSERAERLREARVKAGYRFASDAANALGIVASTYRAHENGQN
ncbi:helix-turn-helix transcriptional regulator, partial [Sinorhizobium meliloti]